MNIELAKAKQIEVEASSATVAGTLQELIEAKEIYRETDITVSQGEDSIDIESSTGSSGTITAATNTSSGVMSKDDKVKLNDLPDSTSLNSTLATKVDKVTGKSLALDTELVKLSGYPSVSTMNSNIDSKVPKESGKELIPTAGLNKLNALPTAGQLSSSFDLKVDKVSGKSLVDDTLITKLAQLRDNATITSDLDTKVDKVAGKDLSEEDFTTSFKDKLEGLREDSVTDSLLDGKVDKEVGGQLMTTAQSDKLDALPDSVTLAYDLGNKVTRVSGKGLIDPAPVDGKEYARKDGAWVEVVGGESALADLTDVDFGTPTDGQVLTYDAATQKSKFTDQEGAGALSLSDLSDVANTPTANNQILKWDNASQMWVKTYETISVDEPGNGPAYVRSYNSWQPLSNYVIVEAPTDGKLYARSSGLWKEAPSYPTGSIASRPHWLRNEQTEVAELKGLYDVSWGTPSGGDVLTYNSNTAKVEFGTGIDNPPNDNRAYVRVHEDWEEGVRSPITEGTFSLRKTSFGTSWTSAFDSTRNKILLGPGATGHNGSFGGIAIGENSQSAKGGTVDVGAVALGKAAKAYNQGDISIGAAAVTGVMSGQGVNSQMSRTAIGTDASAAGGNSIALGTEATSPHYYSVALGYGAAAESNNEIRLGDVDAIVKTQSPIVEVSDERDKADIQEHGLGLEFIKLLRPVKWKNDPRASYSPQREDFETYEEYKSARDSWDPSAALRDGSKKGQRFQYGLIAQQVKEAMDTLGVDFSGYKDDSITAGGSGNKALAYTDFISPLILAVQQLSERVEELETQLGGQQGD